MPAAFSPTKASGSQSRPRARLTRPSQLENLSSSCALVRVRPHLCVVEETRRLSSPVATCSYPGWGEDQNQRSRAGAGVDACDPHREERQRGFACAQHGAAVDSRAGPHEEEHVGPPARPFFQGRSLEARQCAALGCRRTTVLNATVVRAFLPASPVRFWVSRLPDAHQRLLCAPPRGILVRDVQCEAVISRPHFVACFDRRWCVLCECLLAGGMPCGSRTRTYVVPLGRGHIDCFGPFLPPFLLSLASWLPIRCPTPIGLSCLSRRSACTFSLSTACSVNRLGHDPSSLSEAGRAVLAVQADAISCLFLIFFFRPIVLPSHAVTSCVRACGKPACKLRRVFPFPSPLLALAPFGKQSREARIPSRFRRHISREHNTLSSLLVFFPLVAFSIPLSR